MRNRFIEESLYIHNVCSTKKLTKRINAALGKLFCGTDVRIDMKPNYHVESKYGKEKEQKI